MSSTIRVNHAELGQAASRLSALGSGLASDARLLRQANASLCSGWTGVGSPAFRAASQTMEELVSGAALVASAEALTLRGANANFAEQDAAAASGIASAGQ